MDEAGRGRCPGVEAMGRTIAGRYRLLDQLGRGGMGIVWRAHDEVLDRYVAVKEVTFPDGVSDQEREVLRERTRREGRAAARLDHPSAVTVYDVAEQDGTPFLVMELVEARTLSDTISSDGPLSPRRAAEVGLAVLGALEAAHAWGIVHRDVKPANVLLRPDGRVVLTDFGIATFSGDSSLTSTGLVLGSPSYIAPERARGEQPGPPSDLWSLGATLFTAVEGRPAYDKGEPLVTLAAVITGEHEPFERSGPLAPVLDGLLNKDPLLRFDASRARAGLRSVLAMDVATVVAPVPAASRAAPGRSDRTQALSLGAVAHEVQHAPRLPPRLTPGPARGRSRIPVIGGAAALVAAVVLVLVSLPGQDTSSRATGGATGSSAPPSSSVPPSSSTPRSASPSTAAPRVTATAPGSTGAVPAGYVTRFGSSGSVAVPASYVTGSFAGFPEYKEPGTGRTLRVSSTPPGAGKSDAVQDRRGQAAFFASRHANYHEIVIVKADYRGLNAADWEFTYSEGGTVLHALSRVFVVGGRGYSLFFQTRASDNWSAARTDFDRIAASFHP